LDGGILAICERMFITTQSDIFYVNGIPQSTYARIFNNDEVLVLDLDSNGNTNWFDIVNKNQSSINDGGYYNGIVIMVNDAEINILYNDRLSANADIIQVSYNSNGEHSKKILLNNDQFYALLIPSEYNQVTANSIVLPINQNRDFTFIKLLY
jgi:cellulose biosynthesis protein BcsQ